MILVQRGKDSILLQRVASLVNMVASFAPQIEPNVKKVANYKESSEMPKVSWVE